VKIEVWSDPMRPPEGFQLGPPPQDFGCPRAAYSGTLMINRGDAVLTRKDGTKIRLDPYLRSQFSFEQIVAMLTEAATDGFEVVK
jgi:hypothetical protein